MNLRRAAPYIRRHRGATIVVKIGGALLERPSVLRRLATDLALVDALGARLVVVHGAGPQTDAALRASGEEPQKLGGRRVTTPSALEALTHTTLADLGPALAGALTAEGARALGLCAASAGVLVAERRPPVATADGVVDFGEVGDLVRVDPAPLLALLDAGVVPVLAPPASDGAHGLLNVNADLAASHVAAALGAAKLVLVTSERGVLSDPDDPHSVLSKLALEELDELQRLGVLAGGMQVKASAIRNALTAGVARVHVVSGLDGSALFDELYTAEGAGTLLTLAPTTQPEAASVAASIS